jgi:uncharacterized membrane protein
MAEVTPPAGRNFLAGLLRLDPVWTVAIVAAVVAGLGAIFTLGVRPLWLDELFTLALASPRTPDVDAWAIVTADVHPPLYFLGVRIWLDLSGAESEWAARSFNLIFLGLAALGAAWAARLKVQAPMALWIALFFTSFGVLWYLQEARMYAGLIASAFFACVVALAYEKVREHPTTRVFLAAVTIAFVILPFTHWFAALFSGLVLFGLFVHALIEKRRVYAVIFFAAGALLAILAGAWILQLWASTVGAIDGYDSGASMELWQLRQGAVGTLLFAFTLNPILMLAAAWAITGIVKEPTSRPVLTLLVICALAVPALILLVSLHTPLNQTRNFAGFVGPATLLAAMGLQQIAQRLKLDQVRAALALAGVLAVSLLLGLNADRLYPALERDEWRTAGAYVRSLPGCDGEMIPVSTPWERRPEGAAVGVPPRVTTSMRMYGYYAGQPERLAPVYGDDTALPPGAGEGACPIAFWIGHTTPELAERRAQELLGAAYSELTRVDFAGNAVFVRKDASTP